MNSLIKRGVYFASILLFIMCKTNNAQDTPRPEQIIRANYYDWIGGVKGVKGIHYEFILQTPKDITVKKVVINNTNQPFKIKKIVEGYKISIDQSITDPLPTVGENPSNPNVMEGYDSKLEAYIEYYSEPSNLQKINLPHFKKIESPRIP